MTVSTLAELDLPWLGVDEPGFSNDPVARFAEARAHHPWLARCSFGHVVTEYRAIRELMRHEDQMLMGFTDLVELMGATGTPWGDFIAGTVQVQSGETHKRLRAVLAPAFTPREANRQRPLMREVIEGLIEEWAPKRSFDFELFASYFPITVMCRMLGASPAVIPRLRSSLEALGLAFGMGRDYLPTLQQSVITLQAFVRELVADRRAGQRPQPEPDLLDRLIDAHDADGIDEEELYNLLIFLFGAGYDTSKNVLTLIMHRLLERPADYARCGEDPAFARRLIDEALRYESPSSATRRVIEDFTLRDVHLPAGTLLMIPWSMLGRDPTAVADPDVFIPERPGGSTHVAFGLGPHICLGQFIARAQIEEGLHLIARRLRKPRLAGPIGWRPFPGVWGIRGLPIKFETSTG
jgi:cytochrome P450